MYPSKDIAQKELELAGQMNPGPWTKHSLHVAEAAEQIARKCEGMDSEKTYVCGLLHDIGRRTGVAAVRHIIDGYDYAISKGWDEVARICLTHSFPELNSVFIVNTEKKYHHIRNRNGGIFAGTVSYFANAVLHSHE